MPRIPWWSVLARARFTLGRHPSLYWGVAACCAVVVAAPLASAQRDARASQRAWGRGMEVWVAVTDLPAGGPVRAEQRTYPEAMVPAAAVGEVPPGTRAARSVAAGEVLTDADLAGERTPPADWVVLAVPSERTPVTSIGDRVVVFGAGARRCDGIVSGFGEQAVEVAVPPACAAEVTTDLTAGDATLARAVAP